MPKLSEYGTKNPNAGRPANGDAAAWGGYQWPEQIPARLLGRTKNGVLMRKELVELWDTLFEIAKAYNYTVYTSRGGENWGPWGYENRPISGTNTPSGHSIGVSVDINAPLNPWSYTFQCNIPVAMVRAFEECGMFWGGRYVGIKFDPMHFGYCYGPSMVETHLAIAKRVLQDIRGRNGDWFDRATETDLYRVIGEGIRASL